MDARLLKRLKWDSSYFSTSSFSTSLFPVKDFKRGTIVKVVSNRFIVLRIHALFVFSSGHMRIYFCDLLTKKAVFKPVFLF